MTDRTISPPVSPLRRRMTEDRTIRGFTVGTQRGYIVAVENFTSFHGRAPDGATAEEHKCVTRYTEGFSHLVASMRLRLLPSGAMVTGRDWHPLKNADFARRILTAKKPDTRSNMFSGTVLSLTRSHPTSSASLS